MASRHIIINELDDEFRVRYFYTLKGEHLSQNVEKEYDKQSPVETVVLWYLVWYKWDELRNFMKCQGTRITRESDGLRVTLENAESDNFTKIMFNGITDMLIEFAQDYSYTEVPVRLRNAITFMVQSDPPDAVKSGDVVLVSNKYFGLVGHQDKLDDTRMVLVQRAEDLQIYKETVDIQPVHEELVETLCVIETLKQKHQVQIVLQGDINVSGTKRSVEKCVAEYNSIVSGIKSEAHDISESLVDLLKNKEVQDYILEELRRENIRCVWRVDEHDCKVLVYSLDSKTSREACTIICESIGERTYPKEICTKHEVQSLLKRHESLLKISERDEALYIVGVGKIIENIDDVVKHQGKMQEIHKQVKSGNIDARGHSQVQNEAGKYKQDKTGKRDGRKHSLVQNTDVLGHKIAQCPDNDEYFKDEVRYDMAQAPCNDLKDLWRHDMTQAPCNDDDLIDGVRHDITQTPCNDDDLTDGVRHGITQAPCNDDDLTNGVRHGITQAPYNDDDLTDGARHDITQAPYTDDDLTGGVRHDITQAPCNDDNLTDGVRHDITQAPCNDDYFIDGVRHDITQAPCNDDDLTDGVRHGITQAPCNEDDFIDGVRHDITQAPCNDDDLTDGVRHVITQAHYNDDDLTDGVRHDITHAPCNDVDLIGGVRHDITQAPCNDDDLTDGVRHDITQAPYNDDDLTGGVRHDITQAPYNDDDLTGGVRHDITQAPCNDGDLTDGVRHDITQAPCNDDDLTDGVRHAITQAHCNDDDFIDGVRHDISQAPYNDDDFIDGVRHDITQASCNDDDLTDGVRHDISQAPCNDDDLTDGVRHDITQTPCDDDDLTDGVRHDITQSPCNDDGLTVGVRHDITQGPCNDDDLTDGVRHGITQAPCNDDHVVQVQYGMAQSPVIDDDIHSGLIDQSAALPIVRQQFPVEQPPPATSKDHSFRIERSTFDKLENPEMRAIVKRRLQDAQLQCQWQVQAKGFLYYLVIVSDKYVIIRDTILQTAEQYKSKVSKPVVEETEVRSQIDKDMLIYMQEHQKETLKTISDRYGVTVNLEFNDEFVIKGERENTYQAKSELMKLCRGIQCCKADVEADTDLGGPEITAKLRDLEMKERCVIEFPGVQHHGPRCLYSWVFPRMIVTITCGPVENSTADIIVLPVNAQGDVIGDIDVKQEYWYFDQSQAKSKFIKEKILCLPNSTTLDCLYIALGYIPEWTHEKQIDDGQLKKFDKLLKYAIDKGIGSVVIPVDITEGFPFSTFGYKLVLRLLSQQRNLYHRLEIFLCTRTVYNGYLLKSKLKSSLSDSDKVTEVLFGIEHQLEINRGLCLEKALQIVVQSESMIAMQSKVDVIVNFVGSNLDLSEGCVSRTLLNAGGRTIQKECSQNYPNGICYGDVAVTGPGRLQCKMLCHGSILGTWIPSGNFSLRVLKSVLRKCLVETDKRQYETIAIPAVGTGTLDYPYHRVAEVMFDVVTEYHTDHQNTCLTDVFFVIHQDDQKTLQAFEFQEKRNRKRPKQLHTAVKDDQPVEYIESFLPDPPLRFQIFQRTNAPLIIDKPETVVTFDYYRSTGPFVYKLNMDGNYLDITAHNDGTYETFKMVVKEILNMTEENQITSIAFHVDLNSFATRSPVELAECVKDVVYLRTFPEESFPTQTTKPVCHYIRQIQFVVYNKIDIRSCMPRKTKSFIKKLVTNPLEWHFVSYPIRSNSMFKVLAEDGATLKRVQDEVRRLVKQQVQKREPDHGDDMREEGLSVPLTE